MRIHISLTGVICLWLLFAFPLIGQAKVIKTYDDTDFAPVLYSSMKTPNEPWQAISFWKTQRKEGTTYSLETTTHGYKEWIFFSGVVAINIDETWYEIGAGKQATKNDWPNVITTATYTVPPTVITALSAAKEENQIFLRLQFQNREYIHWQLPVSVLKEWKEVIHKPAN